MRDTHDMMPEIIDALEQNGSFYGIIQLQHHAESRRYQISLTQASYLSLKIILNQRPLSTMPGVPYRCFFAPVWFKTTQGKQAMAVRVEQGRDSKQIDVEVTQELAAILAWFYELQDWGEAEYVRQEDAFVAELPAV